MCHFSGLRFGWREGELPVGGDRVDRGVQDGGVVRRGRAPDLRLPAQGDDAQGLRDQHHVQGSRGLGGREQRQDHGTDIEGRMK